MVPLGHLEGIEEVGRRTFAKPTGDGWLYLGVVPDLFSRRIVSWSMGEAIPAGRGDHGGADVPRA